MSLNERLNSSLNSNVILCTSPAVPSATHYDRRSVKAMLPIPRHLLAALLIFVTFLFAPRTAEAERCRIVLADEPCARRVTSVLVQPHNVFDFQVDDATVRLEVLESDVVRVRVLFGMADRVTAPHSVAVIRSEADWTRPQSGIPLQQETHS